MEVDRYCNECLGYYSYDVDETDNFNKCRWCGSEDTEEAQKFSALLVKLKIHIEFINQSFIKLIYRNIINAVIKWEKDVLLLFCLGLLG